MSNSLLWFSETEIKSNQNIKSFFRRVSLMHSSILCFIYGEHVRCEARTIEKKNVKHGKTILEILQNLYYYETHTKTRRSLYVDTKVCF